MTAAESFVNGAGWDRRTKHWTRAAIRSWKMDALTRRGLVNAVVMPTRSELFAMRILPSVASATLLLMSLTCHPVHADVGQCWVMFVYHLTPKLKLDASQQEEIGKRLMDAHAASSESDGHILFVCYVDTGETGVLYRISETYAEVGHRVNGYRLVAPSFDGLRLAVREVELASKENNITALGSGPRKKVLPSPVYKKRVVE